MGDGVNTINRRSALGFFGGAILGGLTTRVSSVAASWCAPPGAQMWSALGLSGNVTLPAGLVILDVDASVSSLTIPAGSTLMFHPDQTRTLTSSGNVVVDGTLELSPTDATVVHKIHFDCPPESGYVGGGCDVLASDVGLWVTGLLKLNGAAKKSWTRLTWSAVAGVTTLNVESAAGWRVGDRLVIAPTSPYGTVGLDQYVPRYSDVTISAVAGNTVTVSATQNAHPMSPSWNGVPLGAEVMNLSRNVIIEGTATNRAHVMIHSALPQTIRHAELRYLGPRKLTTGVIYAPIVGRYALHFHSCQDDSRGSLVEGVSIHTIGSHAYVPHTSHGITFKDCVAHEGYDFLYWWDNDHVSSDVTYERCIGSKVIADPYYRGYRMAAFLAQEGSGNRMIDCVAVGVLGNTNAAGFTWGERASSMWEFRGCVSHHNRVNGLFVWHNNENPHFISDFFTYGCAVGIQHGAYGNRYRYERVVAHAKVPLLSQALTPDTIGGTVPQRFVDCQFISSDLHSVVAPDHRPIPTVPVEFHRCAFDGYTSAAFRGVATGPRDQYDFVECTFSGAKTSFPSGAPADSTVRVQNGTTAEQITPSGSIPVAPFFTGTLPSGSFVRGAEKPYSIICAI